MAPLAVGWRSDLPALFQRLADFGLGELLLLRQIFTGVAWLTIFRDKLRRFNVLGFPIEIENLIVRSQIILRMPMTTQAPCHAMGFGDVHRRHVIDRPVATETADAAVHVRGVVVINVIDRAIEPHPLDWLTAFPTVLHRLKLGIILRNLRVAVHACCGVGYVRLRSYFHKAVTVSAIHPELGHVNIVWKRHWLDRLVSHLRVLRCAVIPCRTGHPTGDHNHADQQLEGNPIRPAWKEIGHGTKRDSRRRCAAAESATANSSDGELPMNENRGQGVLRSDAAKWLRLIVCLESNEDSINAQPEGKTKFLFHFVARSVKSRLEF